MTGAVIPANAGIQRSATRIPAFAGTTGYWLAGGRRFADLETVRRAAEYDDIVTRLAELHERLRPEDRNVVMAAEAVLFRLVNGPLDLADARALKESVAAMSIVQRLDDISGRRSASPAL